MPVRTAVIVEGETKLVVPAVSLGGSPPPTAPVFFNPAASLNRDVSVALVGALGRTFCDSLAGVGSRGVRMAKEAGFESTLVDFNPGALRLARRSAGLNRVAGRCRLVQSEANAFLSSRTGKGERFDVVDVDPFGSPVPFVSSALRAVNPGGTVCFTATDAAVLCGVHPAVCERRYFARPLNNHFGHETGARVLAGAVCRVGASLELGVTPVFAHATRHYIRVFVRVEVGASAADASLRGLGHLAWGPECGHVSLADGPVEGCRVCGDKAKSAGPLWAGRLTDPRLVHGALAGGRARGFGAATRLIQAMEGVDRFPPWSFSLEKVSSDLGVPGLSRSEVAGALESRGFRCGPQPFEKLGLKTDAPYDEVVSAARDVASLRGRSQ